NILTFIDTMAFNSLFHTNTMITLNRLFIFRSKRLYEMFFSEDRIKYTVFVPWLIGLEWTLVKTFVLECTKTFDPIGLYTGFKCPNSTMYSEFQNYLVMYARYITYATPFVCMSIYFLIYLILR